MKKYKFILILLVLCLITQKSFAADETYDSYWAKEDARRKQEAIEAQMKIDRAANEVNNKLRKEDTQRKIQTTINSILMRGRNMATDKIIRTQAQIQADKIIAESKRNIQQEETNRNNEMSKNTNGNTRDVDAVNKKSLIDAKARLDKAIEDRGKNDNEKTSDAVVKAYENVEKILKDGSKNLPETKSDASLTPDEFAKKKEQVKLKIKNDLQNIKDPQRKIKVQNVASGFDQVNKNVTDKASDSVSKMESVLLTIESRANDLIAQGAYIGELRTQISNAQMSILDAKSSISLQQSKIYSPEIIDDNSVKDSLTSTRDEMRNDIQTMKDKIKSAYSSVKLASDNLKIASDLHKNSQDQ